MWSLLYPNWWCRSRKFEKLSCSLVASAFHKGSLLRNGLPQHPSSPPTQGLKSVRRSIMFLKIKTTLHPSAAAFCSRKKKQKTMSLCVLQWNPTAANFQTIFNPLWQQLVTNVHTVILLYDGEQCNVCALRGEPLMRLRIHKCTSCLLKLNRYDNGSLLPPGGWNKFTWKCMSDVTCWLLNTVRGS